MEMKSFLLFLTFLSHITKGLQAECYADATASRRFAYNLYANIVADGAGEGNVFLAPATISSALTLVLAGANGTTKEQIYRGLLLENSQQEDALPCLMRLGTDSFSKDGDDLDREDQALVLKMATKVFGERTFNFSREYKSQLDSLGSRLKHINFSGDATGARKRINGIVARLTEKMINNLFPEESINANTLLVIASAIYFKGAWVIPFEKEKTLSFNFNINENEIVQANFMFKYAAYRSSFSQDLNAELLELPYKGNKRQEVSMIVILPNEGSSIAELEGNLTEEVVEPAISALFSSKPSKIEVRLPKFKISSEYKLKPILTRMGITNIFSPDLADFSPMRSPKSKDDRPLYVNSAIHKALIEVDEEGSEAAGATGLTLSVLSLPPQFTCNRPFMIILYEKQSQSILFIGKIMDPTKEK